jgi:hypothetical protein
MAQSAVEVHYGTNLEIPFKKTIYVITNGNIKLIIELYRYLDVYFKNKISFFICIFQGCKQFFRRRVMGNKIQICPEHNPTCDVTKG